MLKTHRAMVNGKGHMANAGLPGVIAALQR
jgi:hypothetical protein